MLTPKFCKNCGNDHLTKNCKDVIISNGVILYRHTEDTEIEYLLICRRDTFGYVEFIRGNYNINNINYIQRLIDEMTIKEKKKIQEKKFDILWNNMWNTSNILNNRCEKNISKKKYKQLLSGVFYGEKYVNLSEIIKLSKTNWIEPEWGFPKGRRNNLENDYNCALREFEEETGYSKYNINIIENVLPYEEIFTGSNNKCYKNIYYLANIDLNIMPISIHQEIEVSSIKWLKFDEVRNKIRPYNFEKKKLITNINNILNSYNIYNI
jgi:8-oxo-dGTP pyrophosphatase MutT (NUDIX family)